MKLLYLTAGAAEMYCGSCLRDNAMAAALKARGHEVLLAPVYTPTRTDEQNVSDDHVLFGGVSVYLQQQLALFRHTPAFLDRMWDSTPALRLASKRQLKVDPAQLGGLTVSMLLGAEGNQRKEIDKMIEWLRRESRFDAVNLPFTLLIGLAKPLREALRAPIVCTLQGEELFLDHLRDPWKTEALDLIRRAVANVDLFLAVSRDYADAMAKYLKVDRARIRVVPLGIRAEDFPVQPPRMAPPYTIGFFGRIAPEKGLKGLADAFIRLRKRSGAPAARLLAGGYMLNEHRPYMAEVERVLVEADLRQDFEYAGAPDRAGKMALLRRMDVFSMPATYDEPKGLSILEAMATGVPVVLPRRGAFPEIVERTGGGLIVQADDPEALASGLLSLLADRPRASALGAAGAAGVRREYGVDRMAAAAEAVYREVARC